MKYILLSLPLFFVILIGCGQTGPLYMPCPVLPVTCVEDEERFIPKYRRAEERAEEELELEENGETTKIIENE